MSLFEWTSDYELDIPQIDNQHKELVKMINTLHASIKAGDSSGTVNETLDKLLQYVDVHFETEEQSMRQRHYPAFEEHLVKHEFLREKVLKLREEQLQGREIATFELLNFLVEWLKEHIADEDVSFGNFIHDQDRCNLV